jgi:hypothetical protein
VKTGMTALMTILLLNCLPLPAQQPGNSRADGLSVFTYKIPVKPSEFVQQKEGFDSFADQISKDAQGVLNNDEITDKPVLKEIYDTLLSKALIDGDALKVLDFVYERRALEENPADRQLNGLIVQQLAESWMEKNSLDPGQIRDLFRFNLTEAVNRLPWQTAGSGIERIKNRYKNMTPEAIIDSVRTQIDPAYEKADHISGEFARKLLIYRSILSRIADFRMDIIEVLNTYIRQYGTE